MQKAIIEGPAQVDTTQVLRRFRVVYSAIRTHFQTVERQLLTMERSSGDRRNVHLHVAEPGLAILAKVPGPFEGVLPHALGALPPATLLRLDQDLATLIGLLRADEEAAGTPLAEI